MTAEHLIDGLHVVERPGPGEAVLWLHGYTMDPSVWTALWDRLPEYRHLGLALPGHGGSRPIAPGEDLAQMADAIGGAARRLRTRHLAAMSFGGMIALEVASRFPEQFETLTLGSPGLAGGPVDAEAQICNLELAALYRQRGAGPWLRERWMSVPPDIFRGARDHPALWRELTACIDRHDWAELADNSFQQLAAARQDDAMLKRIAAATLVLIGEDDMATFKRCAELIRRGVPNATRVHVPATGHLCLLEAPDQVAPLIAAHLGARSEA